MQDTQAEGKQNTSRKVWETLCNLFSLDCGDVLFVWDSYIQQINPLSGFGGVLLGVGQARVGVNIM